MTKRFPAGRVRDAHGRIVATVPLSVVRRMFAEYRRLGALSKVAARYELSIPSVHRLLCTRGFITPRSRRLPDELVQRMYADYCSGLSLEDVGDKYGRTRQSIFQIFEKRRLKLRAREFLPAVEYKGRKYTCQLVGHGTRKRHRYLRDTNDGRGKRSRYLHHVVWNEHNGPVPPGHKVCFRDGDHLNCDISNLELLSNSEQVRKHATGANQFTKTAGARLNLLLERAEAGDRSTTVDLKERAA